MRNDNYPDDIRKYDNVPGSPFFEDGSEARLDWILARSDELTENWTMVNEALGELDKDAMEKIGKLCVEAINANADYRSEVCGRIGSIIQQHICKYTESLADTEWSLNNDGY